MKALEARLDRQLSRSVRYGLAVVVAALATGLRYLLVPYLSDQHPYIFLYAAVLIVGIFGGGGPALLCLILGFVPALYLFDQPPHSFDVPHIGTIFSVLMVLSIIVLAAAMQRRERLSATHLKQLAEQDAARMQGEVAERRHTEEALRKSEQQMRALVESATDYAIFTLDIGGFITGWNVGATRLLGYEEDEIIDQHVRILFTPEDHKSQQAEKAMKLALEQDRADDERWHIRKDRSRFWASGVISPMRDASGRIIGFVKIMRDNTAGRRAELSLRESEERYRRLTELSPDAMIVLIDSGIAYANVAAQRLLGAKRADHVVGRSIFDFIHRDHHQAVQASAMKLLQTGKADAPLDEKLVRPDGSMVDVEATATLVPWKGQDAIQLILHDVTERKRSEDSLRRASELHRLLLRELDHRVRNNLASLISLIEITSSGKTSVMEVAAAIRSRTQAMAAVHQLLSKQHWTTVDLSSLIDSLRPPSAPGTLRTKGPPVAIASRQVTALGMVLQELFSNSTKYGALGLAGGEVSIEWALHESHDQTERLLEMLWRERGGPTPENAEPSSGVGSGLIKGFVRSELRGQATLSYPPQGATHRFSLHLDPLPHLDEMIAGLTSHGGALPRR